MTTSLSNLMQLYGRLEMAVQNNMNAQCAAFCSACASPCCRIDFCRETLDSPFLDAVRRQFASAARWDTTVGWLTAGGCGLAAGRPPVCYEFLCRPILEAQPSHDHLEALTRLAMLLTAAGRRARGNRHLVELSDLRRMNASRLLAQLVKSRSFLAQQKEL